MGKNRFFKHWIMPQAAKKAVVVAFFATLFIPGIQMATALVSFASVVENRKLAPWPAFEPDKGIQKYIEAGQLWFDDHFGFRPFLIRLATQVDYSLFDHSSRIHIGKDGWLYYRSVLDREQPYAEHVLSSSGPTIVAGVLELNRLLRQRGITLIFAPVPLKAYFYPDFVPSSAPRMPKHPQIEPFFAALNRIDDLFFVDSIAILKKTATRQEIFYKTDFHWTDPAAFNVAKSIVDEISHREGRSTSAWDHELKIVNRPESGGQANFMPMFNPPSEIAPHVEPTWTPAARTDVTSMPPFAFVSRAKANDPRLLPPIVVLGDSYFDGFIRSGFMEKFSTVYRAEKNNVRLPELLAKMPPDTKYLLLEFVEVSFGVYQDLTDLAQRK